MKNTDYMILFNPVIRVDALSIIVILFLVLRFAV